jgi:hypothetical protein
VCLETETITVATDPSLKSIKNLSDNNAHTHRHPS